MTERDVASLVLLALVIKSGADPDNVKERVKSVREISRHYPVILRRLVEAIGRAAHVEPTVYYHSPLYPRTFERSELILSSNRAV